MHRDSTDFWEDSPYYTQICAKFNTWSAVIYWIYLIATLIIGIPLMIVSITMLVKLRRPASEPTATQEQIEQILYTDDAQLIMAAPSLASQAEAEAEAEEILTAAQAETTEIPTETEQNSEAEA